MFQTKAQFNRLHPYPGIFICKVCSKQIDVFKLVYLQPMTTPTTMLAFVQSIIAPKKRDRGHAFGNESQSKEIEDLRRTITENNPFSTANDREQAISTFLGYGHGEMRGRDRSPRAKKRRYEHQVPKHSLRLSTISEKMDDGHLAQLRTQGNNNDIDMVDIGLDHVVDQEDNTQIANGNNQ